MNIIRKLFYYRDLKLLLKIFICSLKISFISFIKGPHLAILAMPPINTRTVKNTDRYKITRYVNFHFFIRRKFGIYYSCLMRSILLCYMLREAGIKARVDFGAKKINGRLSGHCWVNENQKEVEGYQTIFKYP